MITPFLFTGRWAASRWRLTESPVWGRVQRSGKQEVWYVVDGGNVQRGVAVPLKLCKAHPDCACYGLYFN